VVICLERGADLHTVQLMPLPLTVSSFSKIQIGFTFLVPAHPGSPGQKAIKRVCVCVCVTTAIYSHIQVEPCQPAPSPVKNWGFLLEQSMSVEDAEYCFEFLKIKIQKNTHKQ